VHYEGFDFGFFLTLFQFSVYTIFSGIHYWFQRPSKSLDNTPNPNWFKWYCLLAALMVAGVGLGNQSLNYLNFPTKILFKSSKLLFAMIVGSWIIKRRYNLLDYTASILLVMGLVVLFMANHQSTHIEWTLTMAEITGIIMIICALMSDAVTSNIQEKILKNDGRSATELIFFGHLLGAMMLIFVCIVTDQLFSAILYCYHHPYLILLMLGYSTLTYMGVQFVHTMTKLFGILVTLTVTSSRKVATVMLSFIIFPKPLTLSHLIAMILVFGGIFLRIYNKNKDVIDAAIAKSWIMRMYHHHGRRFFY
jgi:adenosine 3'-phospho 5'-phosphosulfate transporter B3